MGLLTWYQARTITQKAGLKLWIAVATVAIFIFLESSASRLSLNVRLLILFLAFCIMLSVFVLEEASRLHHRYMLRTTTALKYGFVIVGGEFFSFIAAGVLLFILLSLFFDEPPFGYLIFGYFAILWGLKLRGIEIHNPIEKWVTNRWLRSLEPSADLDVDE